MNQLVNSTLPDETLNQPPNNSEPLEDGPKLIDFIRFATKEIEEEIKKGRVLQQQIDAQRLQINEALARLFAT